MVKTQENGNKPGFSLIELLIVLIIMGMLVAIGIPSYHQHLLKSHRRAAIADLLEIQLLEERYYATYFRYTNDLSLLNPTPNTDRYTYQIVSATKTTYLLEANVKPGSPQLEDRVKEVACYPLQLNEQGVKTPRPCWE